MKQPKHSYKEARGHLWVACSECNRGGNGEDKDKCSCGFNVKRGGKKGCFSGELMSKFDPEQARTWEQQRELLTKQRKRAIGY